MAPILVATDFSEVAGNAAHYACQLARDHNSPVTLLHSFIIPVTFSDTPMPVMPVDEGRTIAEERMNELTAEYRQAYPGLDIRGKIMFGDIVDCIEEYTEQTPPWIIVLGNSGLGDSMLWFGSNVLNALRNLRYPVLAVPRDTGYRRPEKLCFACDFKHIADHLDTEALSVLVHTTNAQLHVLNVDHLGKNPPEADETSTLHRLLAPLNPVYHYVEKEHVEDGIKAFMEQNQMDWLIIVPHKHSFFEGLFHKSHTKAIMKSVPVPLIALKEK